MKSSKITIAGFIAGVLSVGAMQAHAAPLLEYSIDGGAFSALSLTAQGGGNYSLGTQTLGGDFTVSGFSLTSDAPGTPQSADIFSDTATISNTSGAQHTLTLLLGDTGFTTPSGAPPSLYLFNSIGGSVRTASTGEAISFSSYADSDNTVDTTGTSTNATPALGGNNSSYSASSNGIVTSLAVPYALAQDLSIKLGAGGVVNYSDSTDLEVPEPATLGLLGVGLTGLGLARRRRAHA